MPRYRCIEERFNAKYVVREDGCWEWTAARNDEGYGMFWVPQDGPTETVRAHRWSYEHHQGAIPDGLVIDHLCRNRACVNPEHLEPTTNRVNVMRGVGPTRRNAEASACINGHPFDEVNTYVRSNGARRCRACGAESKRRSRALAA